MLRYPPLSTPTSHISIPSFFFFSFPFCRIAEPTLSQRQSRERERERVFPFFSSVIFKHRPGRDSASLSSISKERKLSCPIEIGESRLAKHRIFLSGEKAQLLSLCGSLIASSGGKRFLREKLSLSPEETRPAPRMDGAVPSSLRRNAR